jgi:hypothetical protein
MIQLLAPGHRTSQLRTAASSLNTCGDAGAEAADRRARLTKRAATKPLVTTQTPRHTQSGLMAISRRPPPPQNQLVLIPKSIVVPDWNNFKEKIGKIYKPRVLTGAALIGFVSSTQPSRSHNSERPAEVAPRQRRAPPVRQP